MRRYNRGQAIAAGGAAVLGAGGNFLYNRFVRSQQAQPQPPSYQRSMGVKAQNLARLARLPVPRGRKRKQPLKKRVQHLEKRARDEDSVLIYKVSGKDSLRPAMNTASYGFASCVSISGIESAAALARFFDPAAPGTLVTASLVTGSYSSKFRVGISCNITFKNNYQVPCVFHVAMVRPRAAVSTSPNTARTNGLTDQGAPASDSPMLNYGDSKQFRETYKTVKKMKRYVLAPGKQIVCTHRQASFLYDPSYFDTQTATYQPRARSALWIYRVQGVVGHDTVVATEEGIMPAGLDVYAMDVYSIHYNSGGAPVNTIVVSDGASTSFTTGGVVSQPVVDNQAYSIN